MKTRILLVLSLLVLYSLNSKVTAQWSTSPLVNNFVSNNSGNQNYCQSVSDQKDGAIICWEDNRNGNRDIYAQRINHGVNQWTHQGVKICDAPGDQIHPVLCTDANGGAIITWSDNRNGFGQVWAQRVKVDGTIMWANNGVLVSTEALGVSHSTLYPAIQHAGAAGSIIAMNYLNGVCALKLDAFGQYEWGTSGGNYLRTVASGFNANSCTGVQMCPDGGNGAHCTWSGWDGFTAGHKVYAQHIQSNGENHWSGPSHGRRVCNQSAGHQRKPRICHDEVAGCLITWEDGRVDTNVTTGRPNKDIYCERLDFFGNHMWNSNGNPVCTDTADQSNPTCIADSWEGMHIVWQDYRNYDAGPDSGKGVNLYAQNVHFEGHKRWTHNGKKAAIFVDVMKAQDPRYNPQMCANDDIGGLMMCWLGYRDTTSTFGVYSQRMDYDGNVLWTPPSPPFPGYPHGIPVSTAPGDKHTVTMCNNRTVTDMGGDDSSSAVIAWTDLRDFGSSGEDIYAQSIKSSSDLGDISAAGIGTSDKVVILNQNSPNPFNPSTSISFALATNQFVTVKVYSILGKEVATLVNGNLIAGSHNVVWDASKFTSGTYFYKITAGNFSEIKKMLLIK